jgi:CPA1 family monovalent cation:H+ antiporter
MTALDPVSAELTSAIDDARRIKAVADAERPLRIAALRAERDELYRLRLARRIYDPLHRKLVREVDLMETALSRSEPH